MRYKCVPRFAKTCQAGNALFFDYKRNPNGQHGIYLVLQPISPNRNTEKPMICFLKITIGGNSCNPFLPKAPFFDCRKFWQSSLSAKAHGGKDAKTGFTRSPSNSARALPHGKQATLPDWLNRFPTRKKQSNERFCISAHTSATLANVPDATPKSMASSDDPLSGP
jgi:hypothetical protein